MVLSKTSNGQTSHYWQGLDTLAQSDGTNAKYFEYDGLGSVRQLTDSAGAVQMAQTFDPYGNGYSKSGTATSSLGFTGEFSDASTGFVFLRARYYNPAMGRFLNTDPSRQEQNPYLYSMGNPVMFNDPSGLISYEESAEAVGIVTTLLRVYDVAIVRDWGYLVASPYLHYVDSPVGGVPCSTAWDDGNWKIEELRAVKWAVVNVVGSIDTHVGNGLDKFLRMRWGGSSSYVQIFRTVGHPPLGDALSQALYHRDYYTNALNFGNIDLVDGTFYRNGSTEVDWGHVNYELMHEFGHTWDWSSGGRLSAELAELTAKASEAHPSSYAWQDRYEDWAESFAAYLDPTNFASNAAGATKLGPVRTAKVLWELIQA